LIMIIGITMISLSSALKAQPQQGCGSSGPEHYFNAHRTALPEQLTFLVNADVIVAVECAEIMKIPSPMVDQVIQLMHQRLLPILDSVSGLTPPLLISFQPIGGEMLSITIRSNPDTLAGFVYNPSSESYVSTHFNYILEYPINPSHTLVVYTQRLAAMEELLPLSIGTLLESAKEHIAQKKIAGFIAKRITYPLSRPGLMAPQSLDTAGVFIHQKADRGVSVAFNFGVSHLNNTFVPSVAFPVAYRQSRKSGGFHHYGIMFDMLLSMDPEEPFRLRKNWYADLFFGMSQSRMHLFAGYLIHREGELIPRNACRVGFMAPLVKTSGLSFRVAYHFSATQSRQQLFETGIRFNF